MNHTICKGEQPFAPTTVFYLPENCCKITAIMQTQFTMKRQEAIARLRNTMDKASLEAQERGLTPEILESILNNDRKS